MIDFVDEKGEKGPEKSNFLWTLYVEGLLLTANHTCFSTLSLLLPFLHVVVVGRGEITRWSTNFLSSNSFLKCFPPSSPLEEREIHIFTWLTEFQTEIWRGIRSVPNFAKWVKVSANLMDEEWLLFPPKLPLSRHIIKLPLSLSSLSFSVRTKILSPSPIHPLCRLVLGRFWLKKC